MLTNSDCTVYRYDSDTKGFDRLYIPAVMWQESKAANVTKSGLQTADGVTVFIEERYTQNAPQTAAKDMLVKGNCPFEFCNKNAQSISDSMKEFQSKHRFVTVSAIDKYLYGRLAHFEISAK